MKILIVDDERLARDRLQALVEELAIGEVVAQASNGREALNAAKTCKPEVILLDIRMPGMDGMQIAHELLALHPMPMLIFTTAYGDHALEAFGCQAIDYLLKPIRKEHLGRALKRAHTLLQTPTTSYEGLVPTVRSHISVTMRGELRLIPVSEICCFLADQKYVVLQWTQGEALLDETLKELEKEFAGQFLRIHRNALVAVAQITNLSKDKSGRSFIHLKHFPKPLEVSRRHLAVVKKNLKDIRIPYI